MANLVTIFGMKLRQENTGFARVMAGKTATVQGQVMIYDMKEGETTKVLSEDLQTVLDSMR